MTELKNYFLFRQSQKLLQHDSIIETGLLHSCEKSLLFIFDTQDTRVYLSFRVRTIPLIKKNIETA